MKVTTIRQDDDQADALELIARADGMPVARAINAAITAYIDIRRGDPEFQDSLRKLMESDRDLARRLEGK